MDRIEYKYLIPTSKVAILRDYLKPYVILDKYSAQAPDQNYTVRSVYFDTPRLDFFHEKIAGIKKRQKIRIRCYNDVKDDSATFLEIKRKNGPAIKKCRSAVLYQNLFMLLRTGNIERYVFSNNGKEIDYQNASNFFFQIHRLNLKPMIKIIYEREAYYYKFHNKLRITIDKHLRSSLSVPLDTLHLEENVVYTLSNHCIIEVKVFGVLPLWLREIIAIFDLKLQALSKYALCVTSHSQYHRQLMQTIRGEANFRRFYKLSHIKNGY